jgi:DNA-binding beta-propeller fold protein YncE
VVFATGLVLFAGIVAAVPAALAAPPVNFAGPGTDAGQVEGSRGVAVDQSSGTVYVVDSNERVDEFDSAGHFLRAFGWGVLNSAAELQVCTTACEASFRGSGRGQFNDLRAVAVDQSSHDVYVGDLLNKRVEEFNPAGEFILMFGKGVDQTTGGNICVAASSDTCGAGSPGVAPGALNRTFAIAFDASGNLWIGDENRLERFSPEGAFLSEKPIPGAGDIYSLAIDTDPLSLFYQDFYLTSGFLPGISKLNPAGEVVATLDGGGHPNALGLDPATGDLFVSDQREPSSIEETAATLLEFNPFGVQTEAFGAPQVIGAPEFNSLAFGVAAQRLYVVGSIAGAAQIFALPASGPLPVEGSPRATEVRKRTGTLCSRLNPEGSFTTFHYQYIPEEQFVKDDGSFGAGTLETPESAPVGEGFAEQEACQAISGLTPGTAYRFRVVAKNANGTVDGETAAFQALPPAAIDSTSVTDVAATSATLHAEINPLGDATSYRFEYISEAALLKNEEEGRASFAEAVQVPLEPAAIGAGEADVSVAQHLDGLVARTAYRYRAVAFNALAPAGYPGSTLAFTTQATGAFVLADGRQWELVSPPNKHGAALETEFSEATPFQSAATGNAVTYLASVSTEAEPQDNANGAQVLSTRGPTGWSSRDLDPPYAQAVGSSIAERSEFRFFSADLSLAALHPWSGFDPLMSAEASEQTSYLRATFPAGDPAHPCSEACFHPLVTGVEGFADVPAGTHFSTATAKCPPGGAQALCGPEFRGATSDMAHVLIESHVALTSTPLPAKFGASGFYEWTAAAPPAERLRLVGVLPDGKPAVAATLGGDFYDSGEETRGSEISPDGSRVVFHAGESGSGVHLYLRYNATRPQSAFDGSGACMEPAMACTVQLDAVQGGSGSGNVNAGFQVASVDGSVVYFDDEQRLTAGSGASNKNADLYRCRIVEAAGHLRCELADLTPDTSSAEQASAQGAVLGASPDGSSAYFVANGVLTGTERNEHGETALPGSCHDDSSVPGHTCNLYLYRDGTIRFVAVVSGEDHPSWGANSGHPAGVVHGMSSRVSPDGRWLAFVSDRSLTGYDNRDALTGKRDNEIYLYDAEFNRLRCVSCDPTGARPRGWEQDGSGIASEEEEELGGNTIWQSGARFAAFLPSWPRGNYRSRLLSDSGRLFFESFDPLVPQDSNGAWDVYEYEPPGVGGCTEASSMFSAASGGCVSLVSSGLSPVSSFLVDASESGNDVFFYTNASLSASDVDTARDMYDAHVCGAGAPCQPPPPPPLPACEGDACQSPVAAPEDPTPGSLSFRGPGNITVSPPAPGAKSKSLTRAEKLAQALRACQRKHGRGQRAVCRRRALRSYGARRSGRASAKRGGGK